MALFAVKFRGLRQKYKYFAPQHIHEEWRLLGLATAFGLGCLLEIAPDFDHTLKISLSLLGVLGFTFFVLPKNLRYYTSMAVIFVLAGVLVADRRIERLKAPSIEVEQFGRLEGRLVRVEERIDAPLRVWIEPILYRGSQDNLPGLVRVIVRTSVQGTLVPGAYVKVDVMLGPVPGAIVPDGFSFKRRAYFQGLGGIGFSTGPLELKPSHNTFYNVRLAIEQVRQKVSERIVATMPGQAGAVAAAILVGTRHYLSKETTENFRATGLAHLMAISGLHMGLITAAAYFLVEFCVAAFPNLALRSQPRKIAAIAAWCTALIYLLLSGFGVATVRAFIMVSVALLAILLDRRAISLRIVAIAALIILVITPEAVLNVGFQMSFAATAALIVVYERLHKNDTGRLLTGKGMLGSLKRMVVFTAVSTIVAEAAVAPFALYHFQSMPLVGLAANLLVMPIFSMLVMPAALTTLLLMPFGLEVLVLPILGGGLEYTLWIADQLGSLSFSTLSIPQKPGILLAMSSLFILFFLLVRGHVAFGIAATSVTLVFHLLWPSQLPNILLDNEGKVVGFYKQSEGRLWLSGGRREGFRVDSWQRYWGINVRNSISSLDKQCDSDGCVVRLEDGFRIDRVIGLDGLRESCVHADIVIVPRRWKRFCRPSSSTIILQAEEINRRGPLGLNIEQDRLVWSNGLGDRPWNSQLR